MASDGSQPLFGPTVATSALVMAAAPPPRAATGVWDGPAPKGWSTPGAAPVAAPAPLFDAAKEPRSVLLGNGVRLPLLGVAASDAAGVECAPAPHRRRRRALRVRVECANAHPRRREALRAGCLLVEPGCEAAVGAALRAKLATVARDSVFIVAVLPGAPGDAGALIVGRAGTRPPSHCSRRAAPFPAAPQPRCRHLSPPLGRAWRRCWTPRPRAPRDWRTPAGAAWRRCWLRAA